METLCPLTSAKAAFSMIKYGNVITGIIQEGLTDYDHDTMTTTITRHFYTCKQGEKVCSVGLYSTPE